MAVDPTLKLEIRAVYEANNLSVAKVLDRFPDCEVSPKTVESWVSKEQWQKNRFVDEKEAITVLVEDTLPMEDAKEIIKGKLLNQGQSQHSDLDLEEYGKVVARELCYEVLSAKSLQALMGENLLRAKRFADNSKNIGTNATYHNMLTTTVKTLYGEIKHINPKVKQKIYTDEELESMSNEELDQLLEQ
jgi:CRISPR/Cas system CSM-associated protein Csm2 small subunit